MESRQSWATRAWGEAEVNIILSNKGERGKDLIDRTATLTARASMDMFDFAGRD